MKMYQFCLEFKKQSVQGGDPPCKPSHAGASHWNFGEEHQVEKMEGGIISSWSQLYTPLHILIARTIIHNI